MDIYVLAMVMSSIGVPDSDSEFASFFSKRTAQLETPSVNLVSTFSSMENCRNKLKAQAMTFFTNPNLKKLSDDGFYELDGMLLEFELDAKYPSMTASVGLDGQVTTVEYIECVKLSVSE